jgi:hypothetical protein
MRKRLPRIEAVPELVNEALNRARRDADGKSPHFAGALCIRRTARSAGARRYPKIQQI